MALWWLRQQLWDERLTKAPIKEGSALGLSVSCGIAKSKLLMQQCCWQKLHDEWWLCDTKVGAGPQKCR
jgi:hypothetical protein